MIAPVVLLIWSVAAPGDYQSLEFIWCVTANIVSLASSILMNIFIFAPLCQVIKSNDFQRKAPEHDCSHKIVGCPTRMIP